jgi:hypothetical protein
MATGRKRQLQSNNKFYAFVNCKISIFRRGVPVPQGCWQRYGTSQKTENLKFVARFETQTAYNQT